MTASDPSKQLLSLLKKVRSQYAEAAELPAHDPSEPLPARDLVELLIFSFLQWEATAAQARLAMRRLREACVDDNEIRVCLPHEVADVLGERYPRQTERAQRLRSVLNDIYRREHAVTLSHLTAVGKKDARAYIESLEGIPPYVAARVGLIGLQIHAIPADHRLADLLVSGGGIGDSDPAAADPLVAGHLLERAIRAEDALSMHAALQAWADEHGQAHRRETKAPARVESKRAASKPAAEPDAKPRRAAKTKPAKGKGTRSA